MTIFTINIAGLSVQVQVCKNPLQTTDYSHMSDSELVADKSCNHAWWVEYKKRGLTAW